MTLTDFRDLLLTVDPTASHYEPMNQKAPYTVWAEYGENAMHADNDVTESAIKVQVDYFTRGEYDPRVNAFKAAFAGAGIAYEHVVDYEREAKLIRHIFDCEVA